MNLQTRGQEVPPDLREKMAALVKEKDFGVTVVEGVLEVGRDELL